MVEIKNRYTGEVIFRNETWANLCGADLCGANLREANLRGANLRGANLCGANLRGANLREANLCGANLREANLCGADLCGANLCGADLCGANLCGANLCGANLCGADLCEANLRGANLCGANLREADLREADLQPIKEDFFKVLDARPNEVQGLRQALVDSNIDGSCYEGECACLVGTIANVAHCKYTELEGLKPDGARPAERWFLAISPYLSIKHPVVNITLEWIDEWTKEHAVQADNPVNVQRTRNPEDAQGDEYEPT